jgi:phosphoribosylanthranilate isomerase
MGLIVKICGLKTSGSLTAAVTGGARYIGFVFCARSPRAITAEQAGKFISLLPEGVTSVGLFVDPDDMLLNATLAQAPLGMIQLHGDEAPERVAAIRQRYSRPVMKAIGVATATDLDIADRYDESADMLLFDAKPPRDGALPGGNGLPFSWDLLKGRSFKKPWMLAGGLTADNLADAVAASGAHLVDVSSGVEDAPGEKSVSKIKAFLEAAAKFSPQ